MYVEESKVMNFWTVRKKLHLRYIKEYKVVEYVCVFLK